MTKKQMAATMTTDKQTTLLYWGEKRKRYLHSKRRHHSETANQKRHYNNILKTIAYIKSLSERQYLKNDSILTTTIHLPNDKNGLGIKTTTSRINGYNSTDSILKMYNIVNDKSYETDDISHQIHYFEKKTGDQ